MKKLYIFIGFILVIASLSFAYKKYSNNTSQFTSNAPIAEFIEKDTAPAPNIQPVANSQNKNTAPSITIEPVIEFTDYEGTFLVNELFACLRANGVDLNKGGYVEIKNKPSAEKFRRYLQTFVLETNIDKNIYDDCLLYFQKSGSYEDLGDGYKKDSHEIIYYQGKPLLAVDTKNFSVLSAGFAKDGSNVYKDGQKFLANPEGFTVLSPQYTKDRENAYFFDFILEDVDTDSFTAIPIPENITDKYIAYAKDKNQVYMAGVKIPSANSPESFVILQNNYSKDKNNVYYRDKILDNASPENFEVLQKGYARDQNSVFYEEIAVRNMDPASVLFLECAVKDNKFVYSRFPKPNQRIIPRIDSSTFRCLNGLYSKDKNSAYYNLHKIKGAEPKTFERLVPLSSEGCAYTPNCDFAVDKDSIYYTSKKIVDADVETFQVLGKGYAIDQQNVYYRDQKIAEADVNTFTINEQGSSIAKDKNHIYSSGKIFTPPPDIPIYWNQENP